MLAKFVAIRNSSRTLCTKLLDIAEDLVTAWIRIEGRDALSRQFVHPEAVGSLNRLRSNFRDIGVCQLASSNWSCQRSKLSVLSRWNFGEPTNDRPLDANCPKASDDGKNAHSVRYRLCTSRSRNFPEGVCLDEKRRWSRLEWRPWRVGAIQSIYSSRLLLSAIRRWECQQSLPSPITLRAIRGHSELSCLLILEASLVIRLMTTKPSNTRSYAIVRLDPCLPVGGYMPSRGFESSRCVAMV